MQKYLFFLLMVPFCFCAVSAQETGQVVFPLNADAGGTKYIREWLLMGPFFPDNLDADFLLHEDGEANIEPVEGDTIAIPDGRSLAWKRYKSKTNAVNLLDAVGDHKNVVAYAFCIIKSDTAGEALFYAGSDDGIAVWINGKMVHHNVAARALALDKDIFRADLKAGDNRCLVKVSQGTEAWGFALRVDVSPANPAVLSGTVTDETGQPVPNVAVYLEQNREEIAKTRTDSSGNYRLEIYPVRGSYDLYATKGEGGDLRLGIPLREGQSRTMNLALTGAVKIEGMVLMLDGETPHVACVVQAVVARRGDPAPQPVATALTDETGKYKLVNLKPGSYQIRCYIMGGYAYYRSGRNFVSEQSRATPLRVRNGKTIKNIDFRFAPFKKGTWKNYTYLDGLTDNYVNDIHCGPDGVMWFATGGGGVSRYDGKEFVNFTTEDGLADNDVSTIYCDPDGDLWFGTGTLQVEGNGVSRYDGKEFVNFTIEDGLADNRIYAIHRDPDSMMWFGTENGVSRYDGKEFTNFTTEDGLADNRIYAIHRDPDSMMWFGTENGVFLYDGKEFVSFTTEDGLANNRVSAIYGDPDGVMWFGTRGGVFRYDGKELVNLTRKDGLAGNWVRAIYRDPDGVMWFGTWGGGVSRYDGKGFANLTRKDGLAGNRVRAIYRDPDGVMWFGTHGGGVSRYDTKVFSNLTTKDGLADNSVVAIYRDPDGVMWFGTWGGGVSRYDGKGFANLTTKDGLAGNWVPAICRDPDGVMWFGTGGGVSRYDGKAFVSFTTKDGLANDLVPAIHSDSDGVMWFGTGWSSGGGVSRYDGKGFVNFTAEDGLASNAIHAIHRDPDGMMWFGTRGGGASRYDGKGFFNLTTKDGLPSNDVNVIYRDPDGVMWFGTRGGISRYDGKEFVNFTTKDGLVNNVIATLHRSPDGVIWFGTEGGGVAGYDGTAWTSLDTRDKLAGNAVYSIHQDSDGFLWFGTTAGGVTRYRRTTMPPGVRIVSVTTDKTYRDLSAIPEFAVGTRVTIGYSAIDFKTVPEKRQYRCRIKEIDTDWRKPTKADSFDYTFDKPGDYTFEVQAIDRDLNYSKTTSVSIVISPPAFYRTGIFLIALLVVGGGSLCGLIILAGYRMRASRAEKLRLQHELEDAHKMQVRLLPESAPAVEGFDIAGFSKPAREVGGDFFDYLPLVGGRTGVAIADVSDKGLKGAMNAVLASGMLQEVAKIGTSCGGILSALNADLYPRIEKQMFTALGLAVLERDGKTLYWANAAQPYPLVRRGDQVFEIKNSSELPLGMMQNITYRDWELDLKPGDVVIFYTDGIIEAGNETGEMYGIERMEHSVERIDPERSAEEIIQHILHDVTHFVATAEQYDDMTIVVVKRL